MGRKESNQTNKQRWRLKPNFTYTCLKKVYMKYALGKMQSMRNLALLLGPSFYLGPFHRCPHLVLPRVALSVNTKETCIVPCLFKRDIFAYGSSEKTLSGNFPEIACFVLTPDMLQKRRLRPRRIAYLHVTQVQPADWSGPPYRQYVSQHSCQLTHELWVLITLLINASNERSCWHIERG